MARPQQVGTFSPEQARLLWIDYQERKQLQPQLQQNFPRRRQLDEPSPHRLFVRNSEDETLPAYGCVEITTTVIVSGRTVVEVRKPATLTGEYLFISQYPIPPKNDSLGITGIGWAYRYGIVRMLGTPPLSPRQYRPIVSSYEVEEGDGPFAVFGSDNVASNTLIGRIDSKAAGESLFSFALTANMASKSAAANISTIDGIAETTLESSTVYDPRDIFSVLENGDTGLCIKQGGKYYIIQANCPSGGY